MAFAALSAFAVAGLACFIPGQTLKRLWPGWAWSVPVAVMGFFVYMLRGYFLR
jgi:hypothetical protein